MESDFGVATGTGLLSVHKDDQNLSHLSVHVVNHLLRENQPEVPLRKKASF